MAQRNFTPTNQVRLTNVAIVKYKKGGKRFELACFRNKVMAWRTKSEKDLDEVLQIHTIFTNVSKGQAANSKDLAKAFGDKPEADIVLEILAKGQLQVSKEERERANEQQFTEVARMVTERCVNPDTQRPYTMAQIERAMKDIHVSIKPNQPLKKQALEVMAQLKESIPIDRAQMRLRIALPQSCNPKAIKAAIQAKITIEEEDWEDGDLEIICTIQPGVFRDVDEAVRGQSKGKGQVEIMSVKTVDTSDQAIE